ncbi:Shedu anti-phage system protein SduA domain-containing protein [Kribbella pittospori]|nr:Shedu anti-phage system protein SduA domain-containing protein [Kribbella pittospori]
MRATMAGNSAESHNALADLVGAEPQNPLVGRHPIIRAMEGDLAGKPAMQPEERNLLLREAATQSRAAATEAPAELGKLRHDIQLVTLEVLIEQFAAGLKGGHRSDEGYWQEFFVLNTFALQQLFAAPVALYRPQLHVRSGDALGRGARIADFMLINSITRSAHLVEIKTPAARLLGSPYRNIYPPNVELSGAVAQIQAQIESTRVELPTLIARTPELAPIENCVVRGAVLAGTAEPLNAEQAQSFMRYRDGLGTVNVITFDEVLARPQGLHRLLADPPDSSALS